MRAILIFKLKLRVGCRRKGGDASGKAAGILRTDTGLEVERRWL